MRYIWSLCKCVLLGWILEAFLCPAGMAQEQPPTADAQIHASISQDQAPPTAAPVPPSNTNNDKWRFQSLAYLWFPGIHGTVGERGYDTSVHVSASDILSNSNIGLMGNFEADHNRWGLPFDYVWVKLADDKALTNFPDSPAKATIKEGIFTPKVTYLIMNGEKVQIRATAGLRVWHLGQNLELSPPNSSSVSIGSSQNWADFVAGGNFVVPLSPKIFVMVLGDAGGGGANVDYEIASFANLQIKPKWGIGAGFRYVDVNYRNSNTFIFDTAQSGIVLTLLYKFGKQPGQ
ncbi:MAG TPA: hypothetical protein VGN39_07680 [Terriglobales bacterium]|nr:hypothetical protein [Terriglobales bacterium]